MVSVRATPELCRYPENLAQIPGVARTETMVAFRCYSNYDLDRIWSQGFE